MHSLSLIVLDNTLELAADAMTSVDRVMEDVQVIRGYLDLLVLDPGNAPEYVHQLRRAIHDLKDAADQNRQIFIAMRLEEIVRQLQSEDAAKAAND